MKVGFIGLGNVGGKLAGSLLRNGFDLTVRDLDRNLAEPFLAKGAHWAESAEALARSVDLVVTCLPSPAACSAVMEGEDGVLKAMGPGKIWAEMSTTDADEMARIAKLVQATGAAAIECPVSGGCHRAATGNISIFAGCERSTFDRILPLLTVLGRRVLHTGPLGTASVLKVATNYLATANLITLSEALTTMAAAGIDLAFLKRAHSSWFNSRFSRTSDSLILIAGVDTRFVPWRPYSSTHSKSDPKFPNTRKPFAVRLIRLWR